MDTYFGIHSCDACSYANFKCCSICHLTMGSDYTNHTTHLYTKTVKLESNDLNHGCNLDVPGMSFDNIAQE